jgi:hypothetical protein
VESKWLAFVKQQLIAWLRGPNATVISYNRCSKRKLYYNCNWHSDTKSKNVHYVAVQMTVHYLGEIMCKWPDSSADRASVRYSEGSLVWVPFRLHIILTLWHLAPNGDHNCKYIEFNQHCSITLRNSRTNFNTAGEYVTVQNCSLYRGEDV